MFLLAQASDLLYLFLLIFFGELILETSKEILYAVILNFFILKNILLYFYINEKRYNTLTFVLLRTFLFLSSIFYLLPQFYKIKIESYLIILLVLFFIFTLYNLITIYRRLVFRKWQTVLFLLHIFISYLLIVFIFVIMEGV